MTAREIVERACAFLTGHERLIVTVGDEGRAFRATCATCGREVARVPRRPTLAREDVYGGPKCVACGAKARLRRVTVPSSTGFDEYATCIPCGEEENACECRKGGGSR